MIIIEFILLYKYVLKNRKAHYILQKMSKLSKKEPLKLNTSKLNSIFSSFSNKKDGSLVDPEGDEFFQFSQQQINFVNTEQNQIYEICMFVRNVGNKSKKIKLKKPESDLLSVRLDKDGIIAPGLQCKIISTFNSEENVQIRDKFYILSENEYEFEFPINVFPIVNYLEFEPFINFGFIRCGNEKELPIKITNKGNNDVKLTFHGQAKGGEIHIHPQNLAIPPKAFDMISATVTSKEVGQMEGVIDIEPKQVATTSIDFVANFSEYSRMLVDDRGEEIEEIQISPLFGGEKKKVEVYIVNNTPKDCQYRVIRQKGLANDESESLVTPQEFGRDDEEKLISFLPSEGQIQSYNKKSLTGEIIAKIDDHDQQLFCNYIANKLKALPYESRQWLYTMKTYFNDQECSKTLIIKGCSYIPKLCLNSTYFDFGECELRSKNERFLKIQNYSIKKVKVYLQSSGNFYFYPNQLQIENKSFKEVIVRFSPQIIGQLNQICLLKVGSFTFPIRMLGKSRMGRKSTSKFPEDFSGTQLKVEDMENTFLNNEISAINEKTSLFKDSKIDDRSFNSTIHFDIDQSMLTSFSKSKKKFEHSKKSIRNRNGKMVKIDPSNFDPNEQIEEYPGLGRNPQEDRFVSREMTLSEMRNIPVGPVVINFGFVFLGVTVSKTFHICNLNTKPISMQLQTHGIAAFEKSSRNVQVLPAESHGGLTLTYEAIHEGAFKHSLQYILNGKHYFELVTTGTTILPTVQISKSEMKFIAGEDDRTFEKKQILTLTNSYPYEVHYSFKNQNFFNVDPHQGIIGGNSQADVCISHSFLRSQEGGGRVDENLRLKIKNGKKIEIKCTSFVPECNVICRPTEFNFKEVSICKNAETKFILRNSSRFFTVFKVQVSKDVEDLISISTTQTYLAPDEATEVVVKIFSQKVNIIDSSFTIIVRGGRKIVVPIKAHILVPKIRIQEDVIDFGSVPVGGQPGIKSVWLQNQSSIPAQLELVLQNDTILQRCLQLKEEVADNITISPIKDVKEQKIKTITLRINSKCRTRITLEFHPEEIMNYSLMLPLYLKNCNEYFGSLQRSIACKSIKNKLIASEKYMNFGKIIIEQSLDISSKSLTFTLKNLQEDSIDWWVNERAMSPFFLSEKKGALSPNEEVTLKIHFCNEVPGVYERQVQFYINQYDLEHGKPYLRIPVKASASYPEIYFSSPYVIMPVVKLNEESKAYFQIINEGYENLNLKHVTSPDFSQIQFAVKYPKGCNLGITKKSIPIEVTFTSDKPISFTLKVDFYDHHNRIFTILVSGTADNSLYTIAEAEWTNNVELQVQKSCGFLATYLSSLGFIEDPLYQFPDSLIDDDYEKFQKFLNCLSNQFQKIDKNRITAIKKPRKAQLIHQYLAEIIKIIKAQGGFLNQIRPEFLMTFEEYIEVLKQRDEAENTNKFPNYKIPDIEEFEIDRKKAWIHLIYQILKVTSRIPLKKKNTEFWSQFPQREKTIMQWLEQTYQTEAGLQEPKSCYGLRDLGDGEMLSALMSKYTNIKVLQNYGRPERNIKEKEKRCRKIMDLFTQIGLVSGVKVEDLIRSLPRQMLIFLERLYLILPSYLQKGDPVIFSCAMGQSVTKVIQITNPSKHPVTYIAKIQGSKAYQIEGDVEFQIESKKAYSLNVKYISNINVDKENSTLTLTGKASTKFTPSTFIFLLKSVSLGRISEKNIQVTGQLYEPHEFQIIVKNNFASDGDFVIEIVPQPLKNGMKMKSLNCGVNSIKIKKSATSPINLTFLPFSIEKHKFFIIFKDPLVGEFQYEINGIVQQPQYHQDPIRLGQSFFTNKLYTVDINIPGKNEVLMKARKLADGFTEKVTRKTATKKTSADLVEKMYPHLKQETYTGTISPQTDMISLKNDSITLNGEEEEVLGKKKIVLEINMRIPAKDAPLTLLLKNASGTDIRKYRILINSVYKPLRYEMEMKVLVNQKITQPLPLINISDSTNTFNVTLNANESSKNIFILSKEKETHVEAREQSTVEMTFYPKSQQTYTAVLKIENVTTGQIVEYDITGIGEEPTAELLKFSQLTREKKVHQIKLPFTKPKKYTITKCSIPNVKHEKSFTVYNESNSHFKFQYYARFPGQFEGLLHLEDDERIYAYQVLIIVQQSIDAEISLEAVQRTKSKAYIKLDAGEWVVDTKDINIVIDNKFILEEPGNVEFIYEATKTGYFESLITFTSQMFGQLCYKVKITINEMPETIIDNLKVELGSVGPHIIKLENPENFAIGVQGKCTNMESFYFQPENIIIPPRSFCQVKLNYRPTCLETEEGKIKFISDNNMKWNYHLCGQGCLQTQEKVIQIEAQRGKELIESIMFTNPFKKIVTVYIFVENQPNREQKFKLLSKNNKYTLNYMQEISVPIVFEGKNVDVYEGKVVILINEKIFWKHLIRVKTVYKCEEDIKTVKLSSRTKKEMTFHFQLPFLPENQSKNQNYNCQLKAKNPLLQSFLENTCRLVKETQKIKDKKIGFTLNFLSYRPFICPFSFEISSEENGCKWIFGGEVQFLVPPVDDQFEIITQINKASTVIFRLNNRTKHHAKFRAHFTSGSDMEFSIKPKIGDLEPYGRQGTQFEVTFAPTQYKNTWNGKIVIQTDESYWSYNVKGSLPHYNPPIGKSLLTNRN